MVQITQFLRRAVQTRPDSVASECGGRIRTWREFEARAAALAGAMAGLGYRPGDRIGMLALNCDRYLEYFFAMALGGFVFVPINTRLAPPEVAFWLEDSGCSALFIDDAFLPMLSEVRAELRHVIRVGDGLAPEGLLAYEDLIAKSAFIPDAGKRGDDLAGIFYTGGTTGRSKGVMLSHRNIAANAMLCAAAFGLGADVVYLHAGPMFHLADGASTFLVTAMGGKHVFMPRFEPGAFLEAVARFRVTATLLVPTMINMIVHHPTVEATDTSSLGFVLYGASPMPEALIRRAFKAMPHTGFLQAYGQSEAAPCMTFLPPAEHATEGLKAVHLKSAGRAALGCEVRIHDENDNEVPRGVVGEICGRGDNVMLGYWRQPEVTANSLRNGWLHTGDGGYMDADGYLYVVDRMKDMIISGGENIYSSEVEQALYQHPDIAECAVIGVPDEHWGERVLAVVRLKAGSSPTAETIIAHCQTLIAHYKCPREVAFRAEPLPLSGAGKILKTELRKPYWAGRGKAVN
jgi:acyl-CoA synthetase (AMP-forming)/AMP-acid ligase II